MGPCPATPQPPLPHSSICTIDIFIKVCFYFRVCPAVLIHNYPLRPSPGPLAEELVRNYLIRLLQGDNVRGLICVRPRLPPTTSDSGLEDMKCGWGGTVAKHSDFVRRK